MLMAAETFTDPVVGQDFFGREDMLALLQKRAQGLSQGYRQNIAILGPELIGKTSLLQHFLMDFKEEKTCIVYIEFRQRESFEEFAQRYVRRFVHVFLRKAGEKDILEETYLEAFQKIAPETARWLNELFSAPKKMKSSRVFVELLDLPSKIHKETGHFTILILDEFDRILGFDLEEPFAHLGKKIMVQKETMYLLASSKLSLARTILRQRLSLLFGHFETVTLEPFEPDQALQYLEKKWKLSALEMETKHFLIFLSGGNPFYLNVFGEHLSTFTPVELRHPLKSVVPVLEKVLFNARGILNQYFNTRMDRIASADTSGQSLAIFQALAKRPQTLKEIRSLFKKSYDIPKRLLTLEETGLFSKNGTFYRLHDRLFGFWLKSCYERKTDMFSGSISEQAIAFRQEAETLMNFFSQQTRRLLHERFLELFSAFNGEMIEMDQKCRYLPRFSEVRFYNGKKGEHLIIGRKDKGHWVSTFFDHEVNEEDVAQFLKQCKHVHNPIYQRILIPLEGITENARLLAKKEGLWTWELPGVNILLDLFGHGPIVRRRRVHHA